MARHRSAAEQRAIHAKNGGISSKSVGHSIGDKIPIKNNSVTVSLGPLTKADAVSWEKASHSKITSVKTGTFEGKPTLDIKFKNGEDWFEFKKFSDEDRFFEKNNFEKETTVGKFINVDHPKIEGYVRMITGRSLLKDKEEK